MGSKLKMQAKQLDNTPENVFKLETLRFKAYGIDESFDGLTLYSLGIQQGSMIPFGFYINDALVGGCYVSANEGTLYIEQLFVHPQLQNSGLKAGRLLLNYILVQREEIEKYFHTEFTKSALEPSNEKARAIYKKMGYVETESHMVKALI